MLRVGLTGGIACGKSRVLRRLEQRGCRTLDLDRVAHEMIARGGAAHAAVVAAFGPEILGEGGEIDRKVLGARVFKDPQARARLNAIVHPEVRSEERRRVKALGADDPAAVVVVDAALLVEAGLHLRFDRLVVVHCAPEQQLARLMARDGLAREDALLRIQSQMPTSEKRAFAHLEVGTSGAVDETDARADALADGLLELAKRPADRRAAPGAALEPLLRKHAASAEEMGAVARLLDEIVAAEGLELFRVAAIAGRGGAALWPAAPGEPAHVAASALMSPVAALCLARRGKDDVWLGKAAMSVARAVTAEPAAIRDACAAAATASRELWAAEWPATPGQERELLPAVGRFAGALQAWAAGTAP